MLIYSQDQIVLQHKVQMKFLSIKATDHALWLLVKETSSGQGVMAAIERLITTA